MRREELEATRLARYHELRQMNGPEGDTWVGLIPLLGNAYAPADGTAVVYCLIDRDGRLAYLGSTGCLRTRLDAHSRRFGSLIVAWEAFPMEDRETAYWIEAEMLRACRGKAFYLNRRFPA